MDKYDAAVAKLLAIEDNNEFLRTVEEVWNLVPTCPEGCLFQYLTPTGEIATREDGSYCGCLTQVKSDAVKQLFHRPPDKAWTDEMTEKISRDDRIPTGPEGITRENLPVFAEYQREADATFRKCE